MPEDSFRLLELYLNNYVHLKNLKIEFVEEPKLTSKPFTTVLIGPNGTGKSKILRAVVEIFRALKNMKDIGSEEKKYLPFNFELRYALGTRIFSVKNPENENISIKNGDSIIPINQLELPNKLLAESFMLNDTFIFVDNSIKKDDVFYEYLGIRKNSASAGTRNHQKKVVEYLVEASLKPYFLKRLKHIIKFLDLESSVSIVLSPRYRNPIFAGNLTQDRFKAFFANWKDRGSNYNRTSKPFSVNYFDKIKKNEKDMQGIVDFINIASKKFIKNGRRYSFVLDINLNDSEANKDLLKDFDYVKRLMHLDLFSFPVLILKKRGQGIFELGAASSGEYHLFSSAISILSKISNSSLIVIDEPEISLHPSWQMRFVDFIRNVFDDYSSCHFIIATHSHFMVSDLDNQSSSIVSLRMDNDGCVDSLLRGDETFGWPAEQTLYEIFDLPTVRNQCLAEEIGTILELLEERDKNMPKIRERVSSLKKFQLKFKEYDPLKQIVDSLINRFGGD